MNTGNEVVNTNATTKKEAVMHTKGPTAITASYCRLRKSWNPRLKAQQTKH